MQGENEPHVDESKLRRVSISTNGLLFMANYDGSFDTNVRIMELILAMKNKYRLFLITQVEKDGSAEHEIAQEVLQGLIDKRVVKSHRVMYCQTAEGKKAIVRQLSAELHIDTDVTIIEGLQRYMNKFHLIKTEENKAEATRIGKEYSDKIITFRNTEAYVNKLLPSLLPAP